MDVVYVLSQDRGGLPHYGAELANAVAHHADVTVLKPETTTADEILSDDVEVIDAFRPLNVSLPDISKLRVNPLDVAGAMYSYRNVELIDELDPDVVHDVMGLLPHMKLFISLTGFDERYPFVVTFHELSADWSSMLSGEWSMAIEYLIKSAIPNVDIDVGIVHAESQRPMLRDRYLRRIESVPRDVTVIPHGTYDFFGDYAHEAPSEEENSVLFFGNVIPDKGIDVLIESIPIVKRYIPDVTLVIAGDGRLTSRSKRIIDAHPDNFEVRNYYVPNEEVGTLFSRTELVVLPYRKRGGKGHSGTLSIAYSFGKPVVATNAGDFPHLVGDSECGLVVPSDDPVKLADAIVRVLTDTSLRDRMSRNSSKMAERLSWENVAEQHMWVYRRALERSTRIA